MATPAGAMEMWLSADASTADVPVNLTLRAPGIPLSLLEAGVRGAAARQEPKLNLMGGLTKDKTHPRNAVEPCRSDHSDSTRN